MKHWVKRAAALMLCLVMVLGLGGCTSKEGKYKDALTEIVNEITPMDSVISSTVATLQNAMTSKDATAYDAALAQITKYSTTLKEKYQALAAVEAPATYAEQQTELQKYADDICTMLDDSVELYQIAGKSISGDLTEEQVTRINELQAQIASLQTSADKFDDILNGILGD